MSIDLQVGIDALKLVLAGPVGSGKTTAIRSIADTEPVSTEMPLTEGSTSEKRTTTVALDFATVALDENAPPLLVYGIPGQEHFSFMRAIVTAGAIGAIVVLDGTAADISDQCRNWLGAMRDAAPNMGLVVGITKTEIAPDFNIREVREVARQFGPSIPILTFDARDRAQTAQLVRALLLALE